MCCRQNPGHPELFGVCAFVVSTGLPVYETSLPTVQPPQERQKRRLLGTPVTLGSALSSRKRDCEDPWLQRDVAPYNCQRRTIVVHPRERLCTLPMPKVDHRNKQANQAYKLEKGRAVDFQSAKSAAKVDHCLSLQMHCQPMSPSLDKRAIRSL